MFVDAKRAGYAKTLLQRQWFGTPPGSRRSKFPTPYVTITTCFEAQQICQQQEALPGCSLCSTSPLSPFILLEALPLVYWQDFPSRIHLSWRSRR
jgi:hypothetical protein